MNKIILTPRESSKAFLSYVKKSLVEIPNKEDGLLFSSNMATLDLIQTYLLSKGDKFYEKIFKPIILKEAISSEVLSPGSGEVTLIFSLMILEKYLPRIISGSPYRDIVDEIDQEMKDLFRRSSLSSRLVSKKSLKYFINQAFENTEVREIIKTSLDLSGASRKIFVEKSLFEESSISVVDGFVFKLPVDNQFIMGKFWKRDSPDCLLIDGFIENVSEIHHFLENASESKRPHILFVRGMSDDVKNTIYVNNRRGTIDIVPVEIPVTEDTINIFSDLSAVLCADIVSSYKGDLISKAASEKIVSVDRAEITGTKISIQNKSSKNRVSIQIRELKEKRDNALSPEIKNLLEKRIRSLVSGRVVIRVGQRHISDDPIIVEKMDKFFRTIPSIIFSGIVDKRLLIKSLEKDRDLDLILIKALDHQNIRSIPTRSLLSSIKISLSIVSSILSTGCILPYSES
jgi:hypothetical protein